MSTPRSRARFGKRIIAARDQLGWDQKDLAQAASLSPSILSRLENGTRAPSLETLIRLRDALGVDDDTFISWVDLLYPSQRQAA